MMRLKSLRIRKRSPQDGSEDVLLMNIIGRMELACARTVSRRRIIIGEELLRIIFLEFMSLRTLVRRRVVSSILVAMQAWEWQRNRSNGQNIRLVMVTS